MIIKMFLILALCVVELSPHTLLGKACRTVGSSLSLDYLECKSLFLWIDRWILKEDLPNFKQVSEHIYRGGQPLGDGYNLLKSKGIKTIINLRGVDSGESYSAEFRYIHLPIQAHYPKEEDVITFLKVMSEEDRGTVFIHCFHGSDRTGLFVAIYRVVYEGWTKEEALHEMVHGGHGFHTHVQQNLIHFFQTLDLERLAIKRDNI